MSGVPEVEIPGASDDEAAAILAAYEALWPKPAAVVTAPAGPSAWRFSGRWWDQRPRRLHSRR